MLIIKRILLFLVVFLPLIYACGNDEGPVRFNTTQLTRLLAADSNKVWRLTSKKVDGETIEENCNNYYLLEFIAYTNDDTEVKKIFYKRDEACPEELEPFKTEGTWNVIPFLKEDNIVQVIGEEQITKRIDLLTSKRLILTYNPAEGSTIEERYVVESQ